jgi:hypothetical protein
MGKILRVFTNSDQVQAAIAEGGWEVVYGDVINETDVLTFIISIPTGTVAGWVAEQVEEQVVQFAQSAGDISDEVVGQAVHYLESLVTGRHAGEADVNGLGVKGGFATYVRHVEYWFFGKKVASHKLPNSHQPYIALRVVKPLPPKGTPATMQVSATLPVATKSPSRLSRLVRR